jgi:hypothetical protein
MTLLIHHKEQDLEHPEKMLKLRRVKEKQVQKNSVF